MCLVSLELSSIPNNSTTEPPNVYFIGKRVRKKESWPRLQIIVDVLTFISMTKTASQSLKARTAYIFGSLMFMDN